MKILSLVIGALICSIVEQRAALVSGKSIGQSLYSIHTKTCKLQRDAPRAFHNYKTQRFPGQDKTNTPCDFCLGLIDCDASMTSVTSQVAQASNSTLLGEMCNMRKFVSPLFLAYYDESMTNQQNNLSSDLKRLSNLLNHTLVGYFSINTPMLRNTGCSTGLWDRRNLEKKVINYKRVVPDCNATVNELRTFATLKEFSRFTHTLSRVMREIARRVTGTSYNCPSV